MGSLHQPACRTFCCTVVVLHEPCHSSSTTGFHDKSVCLSLHWIALCILSSLQSTKHCNTHAGHASAVQALWRLVQQVNKDAGAIASSVRDGLASSCYPAADNHLRGLLSVLHWVLQARLHLLGTLCMRPIMAAVLLSESVNACSST